MKRSTQSKIKYVLLITLPIVFLISPSAQSTENNFSLVTQGYVSMPEQKMYDIELPLDSGIQMCASINKESSEVMKRSLSLIGAPRVKLLEDRGITMRGFTDSDELGRASIVRSHPAKLYEFNCPQGQEVTSFGYGGAFPIFSFLEGKTYSAFKDSLAALEKNNDGVYLKVKHTNSDYKYKHYSYYRPLKNLGFNIIKVRLGFVQFLSSGNEIRLRMTQTQMTGSSAHEHLSIIANRNFSWEGNFKLEGCHGDEGAQNGKKVVSRKAQSIAEVLSDESDFRLPGFRNCVFTSNLMTSDNLPEWHGDAKTVIPTLRNIRITMNNTYANISYQAYGQNLSVLQMLASENESPVNKTAQSQTQEILNILREGLSQAADQENNDLAIAKITAYFHKEQNSLGDKVRNLEDTLKSDNVSVPQVINIIASLRRAFHVVDQTVGYVSDNKNTLGDLLQTENLEIPFQESPRQSPSVDIINADNLSITIEQREELFVGKILGKSEVSEGWFRESRALKEAKDACDKVLEQHSFEDRAIGNQILVCTKNKDNCTSEKVDGNMFAVWSCTSELVLENFRK